ncbi:MAG: DUF362 domain-containing protein [Desulfuromonadaceae bacterium]|nr:DUF362 domain-containing protein [Desulfuromonadaceae bacterium]
MQTARTVRILKTEHYDQNAIQSILPSELFECIKPGESVVIKPNWVMESHKTHTQEWEYVITHPTVISAVVEHVLQKLQGSGRISILDGPMTEASFAKIMEHYPVDEWKNRAESLGVNLEIIDLRDHEWRTQNGVTVERIPLPGDPRGKVLVDLLGETSEFHGHAKSKRGYYGADYDIAETNRAHDGYHNLYSVSKTVIESDVFINIPKLKTHRKAGITCCLKNLVGINTYKNYLPHHSEGGPSEGGDQFQKENMNAKLEGPLISFIKQHVIKNAIAATLLSPLNSVAKFIFGDSSKVVRNGSWFGNDTVWRMILDLNKILLYAQPDGEMRPDSPVNAKRYIGIVDAIQAGEGEGPLSPDPKALGCLVCGTNPVAIDVVCATLMGFDPLQISTLSNAFTINSFQLCDFVFQDVSTIIDGANYEIGKMPSEIISPFVPQYGWKGHVETTKDHAV